MSVMGFQKKSLDWGREEGVSSIQFFWIFWIFKTLQSPLVWKHAIRNTEMIFLNTDLMTHRAQRTFETRQMKGDMKIDAY